MTRQILVQLDPSAPGNQNYTGKSDDKKLIWQISEENWQWIRIQSEGGGEIEL